MLPADTAAVTEAARILAAGGLVAFPTETVYGLGADATIGTAVARLDLSDARSKVVILLTDGDSNAGKYAPEEAMREASTHSCSGVVVM